MGIGTPPTIINRFQTTFKILFSRFPFLLNTMTHSKGNVEKMLPGKG